MPITPLHTPIPRFPLARLALVAVVACVGDSKPSQAAGDYAVPAKVVVVPSAENVLVRLPDAIASGVNKVGDKVPALVGTEVKDSTGAVVIPVGSILKLEITVIEGPKAGSNGRLELVPVSVNIQGVDVPVRGKVNAIPSRVVNGVLLVERATELTASIERPAKP